MSGSLSDSFANTFHISKVKRGPMRKEIATLRSQTTKLPKTKDQQDLLVRLQDAARVVDKTAKTNAERTKSLQTAEGLLVFIRDKVQTLQANAPKREEVGFTTKTATKEDQRRAEALLKLVEAAKLDIEAMFTPTKGKLVVDMQSTGETKAMTRMALSGQADTIRLVINSSIVDPATDGIIRGQIDKLRLAMQESSDFADAVRRTAGECEELLERGRDVLKKLSKKMNKKALETPLAQKMTKLNALLHPESGLLSPRGIMVGFHDLEQELDGIDDVDVYSGTETNKLDVSGQGEQKVRAFNATGIDAKLEALRLVGEPLDSPDHREVSTELLLTRAKIRALDPAYSDPVAHADRIALDITNRTLALQVSLDTLFKAATTKLDPVLLKITNLVATRTAPTLALSKKMSQPVFQAEWKEIDALIASIHKMIPASSKGLTAESISKLAAAKPLIEAAERLVNALAKKNTPVDLNNPKPDDGQSVVGLDTRLAAHETRLKDADHSGTPLRRFHKEDLAKFKEDFVKFKKTLPNAKASTASDALKKLEKTVADKLDPAKALATYIDDTVTPAVRDFYLQYGLLNMDGALPEPNSQGKALDTLSKAIHAKPPAMDKVKTAYEALLVAFKDIKSDRNLIDKTRETYPIEQKAKADKKSSDKLIKTPLRERLDGLKRMLDQAETEVAEVKGDTNVLKQIEQMIEMADGQVETVDEKEATKTLNRIEQHIDLVMSNPKGEKARRRQELPGLYNQYARTRDTAAKNLEEVRLIVESYAPDTDTGAKTMLLGKHITAYRRTFAAGHGQLRPLIGTLSDDRQPEQARRDAREAALATISELLRGLRAHPLSVILAQSPVPAARAVPGRLMDGLDRLNFTILTSVE